MLAIKRTVASSLIIVFCFLFPTITQAGFFSSPRFLTISDNGLNYRLSASGTWQRTSFTGAALRQLSFGTKEYVVAQTDAGEQLYITSNNLTYTPVLGVAPQIFLAVLDDHLGVVQLLPDRAVLTLIDDAGATTTLPAISLTGTQFAGTASSNGNLLLALTDTKFHVFSWDGGSWLGTTPDCTDGQLIARPLPAVICRLPIGVLLPLTGAQWQLVTTEAQQIASSDKIVVAARSSSTLAVTVIGSSGIQTYSFPAPSSALQNVKVLGGRVFLLLDGWYELDQAAGGLLLFAPAAAQLAGESGSGAVFGWSTTDTLYSEGVGSRQDLGALAQFDRANLLPSGGHLLWQNQGSAVEYVDMFGGVKPVTAGWAKSSQLQDVFIGSLGFILLKNSSGATNLYQTTDYLTWSRLTLPSTPIAVMTIGQARALSAGTLVEVTGSITVLPGAVSSSYLYLQDGTGGIQVYLGNLASQLQAKRFDELTVDGTISTSQAKRISVAAPLDVQLTGNNYVITPPLINLNDIGNYLGSFVTLRSDIAAMTSDYTTLANNFRLHNWQSDADVQVNDTVQTSLIIDYNSSTSAVEGWATDSGMLINRPPALALTPPAVATPVVKKTTSSKSPANSSSTTKSVVATSAVTPPITTKVSAAQLPAPNNDTPAANNTLYLSLLSFCAGIVVSRGRRFGSLGSTED